MQIINEEPTYDIVYTGQTNLLKLITEFFIERQIPPDEAEVFYYYYASMDWCDDNGMKISNWIPIAKQWINNLQE